MTENRLIGENAKIVATLGPGSRSPKEVLALAYAGVDVFRLNFSHGEYSAHKDALDAVRAAEKKTGRPLATLGDLQGPKVRVGSLPGGELRLRYQKEYAVVAAETTEAEDTIPVPHAEIVEILEEGAV
ncbi:pyruvate kinase, partial [Mycolicibacterium poriferae]|uniref:pyruvate kinase n=1 Tax=Mycolicibacterium poriferae TaxID=39694 RepID=UPI00321B989E